jgi:CheY-like chemotaxis protein
MPSDPLRNVVIVVVEDHDDARRYVGIYLRQLGAKVFEASNAVEGFQAIKNNHPNLVLSDIVMPGADGFELLRQIRALGSDAGGSVPVIAMTALVRQEERTPVLDAGFRACLPKPFTADSLLSTILAVLNDDGTFLR